MAIVVLAFAGTAAAHTPPPSIAADLDLRHETVAPERVQSFSIFTRTNVFADLTRIELPPPSIAGELAQRLAVSEKLASEPRRFALRSNVNGWSDLAGETWWGKENKAAPFVEPATGLVYLRDRWYDPAAGTFLTPDPESYTDSSNLYAAFKADPVNNSDPTGRVVPQLIGCGASVGIGFILSGGDYTWKDAGIDCALGAATVGLSALGQLRHLRHASKLTRWGARVGAEMALDVGAEAVRREWKGEEYTWNELATGATLNAILGEGGAYVGRKTAPHARRVFGQLLDAYNNSIWSSEVGAIGHGVRNLPKSRATRLRTLPPLTGTYAGAFDGPVRERTFRASVVSHK